MNKIKTVFFGTHEFAAFILQGLLDSPLFEIVLVITQADQPVGRKQIMTPPLTKIIAQKYNIPVLQPETLKGFEFPFTDFDLSIVIEYGRIIPARLLDVPRYKTVNIHPSLLPLYRGPTPIQATLLHGDQNTGVTLMQMDPTMDTGPILVQKKVVVDRDDTFVTLRKKLMPVALRALLETIPGFIDRSIVPEPQDSDRATYCKLMTRDDGRIDFTKSAANIYNQYRAYTPWPGLWCMWKEKRLKLLEIKQSDLLLSPGQVSLQHEKMYIGTSEKSLEVLFLQLEGKPAMDVKTFLNGYSSIDTVLLQ